MPTELKAFGLAEQGCYIESENFNKPAVSLLNELVFAKYVPIPAVLKLGYPIPVIFQMRLSSEECI